MNPLRMVLLPILLSTAIFGFVTGNRVGRPVGSATGGAGRVASQSTAAQPQVTAIQILFKGHPVDQLAAGSNPERYRIIITGTAFDQSSEVLLSGKRTRAVFVSATQLTARLRPKLLKAPGDFFLQVENPDGQVSNSVILDVISPSSVLSTISVMPDAGPDGAVVSVTGTGFTPSDNRVRFVHSPLGGFGGIEASVPSADGKTLVFTVTTCPNLPCFYSTPPCLVTCQPINPGEFHLSISNANGLSNSIGFLLSSPSGPIGVWGANQAGTLVKAAVTDTYITVDGPCFTALITQTLALDADGNFSLSGTFTPQVGPAGRLGQPAQFTGSVNGGMMTLTIAPEGETPLGPYVLTFGDDFVVPKPCV